MNFVGLAGHFDGRRLLSTGGRSGRFLTNKGTIGLRKDLTSGREKRTFTCQRHGTRSIRGVCNSALSSCYTYARVWGIARVGHKRD